MKKHYISAQQLLEDSQKLGLQVAASDFHPTVLLGVWRGGAPVAIAVQEVLDYLSIPSYHSCIKTSFYSGIAETKAQVSIEGMEAIIHRLTIADNVLIVDDVFDTGRSAKAIIDQLRATLKDNCPQIKLAMPYFKPANNQTTLQPDFFLHATSDWLVFPHELCGLSQQEVCENKSGGNVFIEQLEALKKQREGEISLSLDMTEPNSYD